MTGSRRILGWRVTTSKTTSLVLSALEQALATRARTSMTFTPTGLIHHSDAGSQYTSLAFTEALHQAGITGSIGTVADALDNVLMESTIGLYKTELIDHDRPTWPTWRAVEQATAAWVHWYNHQRLHSAIVHLPPAEYEHNHYNPTQQPQPPLRPNTHLRKILGDCLRDGVSGFVALRVGGVMMDRGNN